MWTLLDVDKDVVDMVPVLWAQQQGIQFLLEQDGQADVLTPDGMTFHVNTFRCDCQEHVYRNHCLHEIWIRQLRPCELCGGLMELVETDSCFGESLHFYTCVSCGNARDPKLVLEERKLGMLDPRCSPRGRCKQAAAWLDAQGSDWYIWQLMKTSPELLSTMVGVLSEAGQHVLADQLVANAGFKAA